jgi:hypothetical protein
MATDTQPAGATSGPEGMNGSSDGGGGGVVCTVDKALFLERMRRIYKSWKRQKTSAW